MKRLAALLLLAAVSAHAAIVMYTANMAGGLIEFSDQACPVSGYRAFVVDDHGEVVESGCWTWEDPNVVVAWDRSGDIRYYNPSSIYFTETGKKLLRKSTI